MKKAAAMFLTLLAFTFTSAQACVTYNPSSGTYTVDHMGCVNQGNKKPPKAPKEQPNKSNPKKK